MRKTIVFLFAICYLFFAVLGCAKKESKLPQTEQDKLKKVQLKAQAAYEKGLRAYYAHRYEQALGLFKEALEINPKFHEAWCEYGIALLNLGKIEEAIEPLKKSVQLKPDYARGHFALACAYVREKRPKAQLARAEYKKALGLGYKIPDWFVKYLAAVEKKRQ
ncbi:MAG: tetratricopeptide repeat protein [Candidatus Omnitrophota bacterium]